MSQATIAPVIATRLLGMGIAELDKEIKQGTATVNEVMHVVRARIEKRIALGSKLIPAVCKYHDELAQAFENGTGIQQPRFSDKAPVYVPKQTGQLPNDPKQLADIVFASLDVSKVGEFVAHLTAKLAA